MSLEAMLVPLLASHLAQRLNAGAAVRPTFRRGCKIGPWRRYILLRREPRGAFDRVKPRSG
jgi:hypothetical protein